MEKNTIILDDDELVRCDNIGLYFNIPDVKYDTLKERTIGFLKHQKNKKHEFHVLKDISFSIKRGECLGVIGHNGAGKSTLLKIVAGIYKPTSGEIATKGDIVLLNFGTGFDMEADAIDNIFLNGALLGFSRKEMKERFNSIIEFSELQDYIKLPLKNYSTGMISRLGFALAIDVHPDLLLVDEVLSVGDANFQKKCMNKILNLKKDGVSFLFVSHNIGQVKSFCEKTMWIEDSHVMAIGDTNEVCQKYLSYCETLNK